MSLTLKNAVSCDSIDTTSIDTTSLNCDSISTVTQRIGDKVELRFYNGKLYCYNATTGGAIGLQGAHAVFDALPSSFHVATMGNNGSLHATVIESVLSFDISMDSFTQEVQDEFVEGMLSALAFDAIIEVLSVGEGSTVITYQVVPASGTSAADLATATTTLSSTSAITNALAGSSVLSTATPTVTVAPTTLTASVPSKIINLALTLPQSRAGVTTLASDWDEDYSYDFAGTDYADMNNLWFRSDALTGSNEGADGAVYIVNNYSATIRVVKLYQGTHTVVKELTNATLNHTSVPGGTTLNWTEGKLWIVDEKIYVYHGGSYDYLLIVFDNLTVGDNTHTVAVTSGLGALNTAIGMSNDAFYYTSSAGSVELKKRTLTDLSTETTVCTLDVNRHIYKICGDSVGNVYLMCVENYSSLFTVSDEAYFYKIAAGTSTPQLIAGPVATLQDATVPIADGRYLKSWGNLGRGADGIWYDNGELFFVDNSSGTILDSDPTGVPPTRYSPGDVFHFRKVNVETGEVSTVIELLREEGFFHTIPNSHHNSTSRAAWWYFKDEKIHAFSDWGDTTVFKQMKILTQTAPNVTVNAIGAFESLEILVNDGTDRELANVITSTTSSTFTPAQAFYQLKALLRGPSSVLNEWVVDVPSVTKATVTAGTSPAQPVSQFTWKKPSGDTWSNGNASQAAFSHKGLTTSAWGHDSLGNIYAITAETDAPILYRLKADGGDNLEKIHQFTTTHYDTCYGTNPSNSKQPRINTFCNQMQFKDGNLYAAVGGTGSGGWGVIRFDDIETRSGDREIDVTQIHAVDLTATVTLASGHGLVDGDTVMISGVTVASPPTAMDVVRLNNLMGGVAQPATVSAVTATTFQYTMLGAVSGGATGVTASNSGIKITIGNPAPDPTVLFTQQGRFGSFGVSNNYIYYWGDPNDSAGTANWKKVYRRNLDGTSKTTVCDFGGQSNMNWIKAIESDGDNIFVLVIKYTGSQWYSGQPESEKVYKFSESDVGLNQSQTFAKEWHHYSFIFAGPGGYGGMGAGMANGSQHRIFNYDNDKLYYITQWGNNITDNVTFDIVTLDTTAGSPSEATLITSIANVASQKGSGQYGDSHMNMVIANNYVYLHSMAELSEYVAGHNIPGSPDPSYALAGKVMRMSTGIPTTVNAATVGPGTMQYSFDGTTWQAYDVGGFLPPSGAYDIQLRMALDYTADITISQIYGQDVNATATVAEGHGLSDGDVVTIRGASAGGGITAMDAQRFNNYVNIDTDGSTLQDSKPLAVSNVTATTFQYTMLGPVGGGANGVTASTAGMKLTTNASHYSTPVVKTIG